MARDKQNGFQSPSKTQIRCTWAWASSATTGEATSGVSNCGPLLDQRIPPKKIRKNLLLEPSWLRRSPRNPTTASHLTGRENRRNRRDSPGTNRAEKSRVRAASKRRGERGGECGGSGRRTARRRRGRGRRSPSTSTSSPSSASPRWESPRPRLVSSLLLRFLRRDLFFFLWHVCSWPELTLTGVWIAIDDCCFCVGGSGSCRWNAARWLRLCCFLLPNWELAQGPRFVNAGLLQDSGSGIWCVGRGDQVELYTSCTGQCLL